MKNKSNDKAPYSRWIILLLFVGIFVAACSKDSTEEPEPTKPAETDTMFNRLITVRNFGEALPEGSSPDDSQSPIYYSLETNSAVPLAYQKTDRWDLSFQGIFRSFIGGNNKAKGNLGEGGPGVGGIMIVKQDFDEVTDIPPDSQFKTGNAVVGTDDAGDFGQGVGYYIYDFSGGIFGDGSFEKQHVAYVMQEGRTIIVKTARGNYAKIQMLSLYKDMLDPATWTRYSPAPFFTFRYVLAKAGSTKFEIN